MSTYSHEVAAPMPVVAKYLTGYLREPAPKGSVTRWIQEQTGLDFARDRTITRVSDTVFRVHTGVPLSDISLDTIYTLSRGGSGMTRIDVDLAKGPLMSTTRRLAVKAAVKMMSGELRRWERDFVTYIAQQEGRSRAL